MGPEYAWYEEYARRIEQVLSVLTRDLTPATVNLVLAHLLISGARVGTGERPLHLGEIYGVNAQQIPAGVQYVGLGHLHRPQEIAAPSRTFYAGSLIELDFGEREQDKRVVMVEARPGKPASIESVPITAGRRLRDVAGTLDELKALTPVDDFLRVTVKVDAPVPGLADQVRELLPNAVDVQLDYQRLPAGAEPARLKHLDPVELFADFYRRRNGAEPGEALIRLFQATYEEAARS
jgi:exonuclease SbcD